jgi:hypothetical protein
VVLDKLLRIQEMLDTVCYDPLTKSNEVLDKHNIDFPIGDILELENLEKLAKSNKEVRNALVSSGNFNSSFEEI